MFKYELSIKTMGMTVQSVEFEAHKEFPQEWTGENLIKIDGEWMILNIKEIK